MLLDRPDLTPVLLFEYLIQYQVRTRSISYLLQTNTYEYVRKYKDHVNIQINTQTALTFTDKAVHSSSST